MKIIILGSEGFIGSHLVQHFNRLGYQVFGCDLVEKRSAFFTYFQIEKALLQWNSIFSEHQFDFCINAAGNGNVNYSVTHPFEDFESNTIDTIEILDSIRKYNPTCRYLHISSAAVYGNPATLPVNESAACNPVSPYGWHKLMAEQICKEYSAIYKLPVAIVRPFSIYGPGLKKQLFWDTYSKYKENPAGIELWGTGKESRDFIYIDDVVNCFELLLNKADMKGEVYNLASGNETLIRDAVDKLFMFFEQKPVVTFNNSTREGDPLNWQADISAITRLGFTPSVGLDAGIRKLADWLASLS